MILCALYQTFHSRGTQFTLFSSAHGIFSRIVHMLDHKTSLDKFKKIEIIPSIFSDHNGMKLETNSREESWKIHKYMVIKQHTLFENLFLIEGQLLYNIVLVFAIQQHES